MLALLVAVGAYAGIKDAQIQQFPPADLAYRTIAVQIKTVGDTSGTRNAMWFTAPEDWQIVGVRSSARNLTGTITAFTMNVTQTTVGGATRSILDHALDLYGTGLASGGTVYDAQLRGGGIGGGEVPVIVKSGEQLKLNFVMSGTGTPLAKDVTWELNYRPTIGIER